MSAKPSICILYPRTQGYGGALSVTAWMAHVLQEHYKVSVLALDRCDPAGLNDSFGTAIVAENVEWISLEERHPRFAAFLKRLDMVTIDQYVIMMWSRSCLARDVLRLSANNEMAFGSRGLQYVNFPMLTVGRRDLARLIGQPGTRFKEVLGRICRLVLRISDRDLRHNYTVCNSQWARAAYEEYYGTGVAAGWLYPPCTMSGVPAHDDWVKRENGIVIIGRLVPKKRVEDGLRIISGLRELGHDLHAHLVSSGGDDAYRQSLEREFGTVDWVHWEENISREDLLRLVSTHRYGMHCNHSEHFGMATAELSGSGCLVLGHNSGGTCEILPDTAQRYDTIEEGMKRLARLHTDPALQSRLLDLHREHSQTFTADAFAAHLLAWIAEFIQNSETNAPMQQGEPVSPPPRLALGDP